MLDFNLTVENLNPLTDFLNKKLPDRINKETTKLMKEVGKIVVNRSKQYAPEDTGTLARSIIFKLGKITGGQTVTILVPSNSRASAYAEYMHEGHYRLGLLSAIKPSAGRKFIERAIKQNRAKIQKLHSDMISNIAKEESSKG